tara:strand:+ start:807 stop:1067 length:261 start_codon:yes stop_codon:yes gene_type:complete
MSSNNEIILKIIGDFERIINKILDSDKGYKSIIERSIKKLDNVYVEEIYKQPLISKGDRKRIEEKNIKTLLDGLEGKDTLGELMEF